MIQLYLDNRKTKLYLTKQLGKKSKEVTFIKVDELENLLLDQTKKYSVFGIGDELLNKIKELNTQKKIHLGLRTKTITNHLLKSLSVIQFNNFEVYTTDDVDSYDETWNYFLGKGKNNKISYPTHELINLDNYRITLESFEKTTGPLFLDYESKGFPTNKGFTAIGVGLYSPDLHKSVYFDYPDDYENIKSHPFFNDFKNFISNNINRIYVYNCPFEMHVDYRQWGIFHEYQDVYVMVLMDGRKGSLKLNGQYYAQIKSWDDEIDKLQDYFKEQFKLFKDGKSFLSRYKDSKFFTGNYISETYMGKKELKEDMLKLGQEFPSIIEDLKNHDLNWEDRIVKHWGNEWAVIPSSIMGYYCGMDCFVTYLIYKKIKEKKYTDACYKTHLYNMYLKTCSNIAGQINVNWNLKNVVEEYYYKLLFNSELFSTLMLYRLQKKYFDETIGLNRIKSYNINRGIMYSIYKHGSFFFLEDKPSVYIKEFINIISKNGILLENEMNQLFGKDWELYFPSIRDIVSGKIKINKNISVQIIKTINDLFNLQNTIKIIIDDYYIINKEEILKTNKNIENYWWKGRGTIEDLHNFIIIGKFDNKKMPDAVLKNLKLYYMDNPIVKYRLKNNFLPVSYIKHILMCTVLDYLYNDLKIILSTRTIISPIDDKLKKYLMYNYKSTPLSAEYGKWIEHTFHKKLFYSIIFYKCYLDNCTEGFVEGQSKWDDFINVSLNFDSPEMLDFLKSNDYYNKYFGKKKINWALSDIYKELTNKQLINFCKCFEDKRPKSITIDDFLIEPNFQIDDLFYLDFFDKIYRLYKFSSKEITSSLKFLNENSYKLYKQENVNIGYYTDEKDKGKETGYFAIPKIIPLSTKTGRFTSGIHTIGGHDDGKLLMINDSPKHMASYFDVSQAEVRMLARMSGDPALQELYKRGGDAYKEMALMAYPYLSKPEYKSQLKIVRGDYKSVFLSKVYRALAITIAKTTGLPIEKVLEIFDMINKLYSVSEKWAQDVTSYALTHKKRKTFLGDTSYITETENIQTTAVNHIVQGATTKILGFGYYMVQKAARYNNIELLFKYTVHDSNINVFLIKDLFKLTMLYRQFFRGAIKNTFGVDFKYDLDLLPVNHRDHVEFKYNHSSGEFKLSGFSHQIDKILNGLEQEFEILKSEENDYIEDDFILNFTKNKPGRDHDLFPITKYFTGIKEKTVYAKLKKIEKYNFLIEKENMFNDEIE